MLGITQRLIEPKKQIPEGQKRFSNADLKTLIIPIVIEQFLALLVGIADTMMISYAGEAAVSGVSLVNQLCTVFIMIFSALAAGGAVVASQYLGIEDRERGGLAASQLITVSVLISSAITIAVLLFGKPLFTALFGKVEADVMQAGLTYLRLSAYSFPALAVYNGCAGLFRSMGRTKTLMNVSIIMNAINVVGNAIGIFVLHAGVAGVAYPTLISRIFAAVVMMILALDRKNPLFIRWKQIFTVKAKMIRRIFHIAVPNSIESGLFQLSKVALSSIVAAFGTVQIAANGVAQSFWSMSALFCIAMGPTFITVIGQYMGAGDTAGAEYYMKKLLRLTYIGSAIWNAVIFSLSPLILNMSNLSAEAVHLTIILIFMHNSLNAVFCPLTSAMASGMRAAGDVKFTMLSSIFSTVICRVALSVLFGMVMGMGVIGNTLAMIGDWAIHGVLILARYRSGKWKTFKVI